MSAVYRNSRLPRRHRPGSEWRWVRHYVPVMVKALILGLLAATMMCGLASAAPAQAPAPAIASHNAPEHQQYDTGTNSQQQHQGQEGDFEDPVARSERSTNLSHITGTARKIQMYIKNRYLQILVDGTVNGTTDDTSAYSESTLFFSTPTSQFDYPAWTLMRLLHKRTILRFPLRFANYPTTTPPHKRQPAHYITNSITSSFGACF